jgi:hypothetical protein
MPLWLKKQFEKDLQTMSMDKNTVRKAANLARIEVPEAELEARTKQLNGILKWIEQLQEVNTDGVEPLASNDCPYPCYNCRRP